MLPELRNHGLGEIILKEVLKDVMKPGKVVYLHSQLRAVTFYERNGFVKQGEIFYEAGMGHFLMRMKNEE